MTLGGGSTGPPLALNKFGSTVKRNGTPRLEKRVIGPGCGNNSDRPSLRSGTAVPSLTS